MGTSFRAAHTRTLLESGWQKNSPLRDHLAECGLPSLEHALEETMTKEKWQRAETLVSAMRDHFQRFRFAEEVEYGVVFVPNPERLDTRAPVPTAIRCAQDPALTEDVVAQGLTEGKSLPHQGRAWLPVVTVVGRYGISAGSYHDIHGASAEVFSVEGVDTRKAMTRQVWGARVLQAKTGSLPDHEANPRWTFTLFPAESLIDGQAESGTILKGKVRYRLGKPDRGIGSARIAPAIAM